MTARSLCRLVLTTSVLLAASADAGSVVLVAGGATWTYDDTGTDRGAAWRDRLYDDAAWPAGAAQLGYGDGDESTVISFGPDPANKYPCYYFRHGFVVANPAAYTALALRVVRDDGCVVYLNGQEVARSNMPGGEVSYATWASTVVGGEDESAWREFAVDPVLLLAGTNVLAVDVHQAHGASTDVSFDLELLATPAAPTVTLVSPPDGSTVNHTEASFTCSATDQVGLANATLYLGDTATVTFSGPADTDDAQLSADQPTLNFGTAAEINVDGLDPHAHAVLKVATLAGTGPGQVPPGSTIVSATLEVNCFNAGDPMQIYRLTEDWDEGQVTWNERAAGTPWTSPGADGAGSHAGVALDGDCTAMGWRTFDITQFVQEWSDGAPNCGIVLTDTGANGIDFYTSESATPPVLTVTYTAWEPVDTQPMAGTGDTATFFTTLADQQDYVWNCLVTNTLGEQSWAPADFRLTVDTHAPDPPVLVAPADGATDVPASPILEVNVSDPDGDPLDVTFYGRGGPPGDDFTIVVLPDTQKYSQSYPAIFTAQTQWIADNAAALNVVFVTHEGDIVENWDNTTQWERADTSMSVLDGVVPYGVVPGNHDQPTTYYNQYFPYTRYEAEPWYGGHRGATNDTNYQLFSAGGDDYIVLHLDFWPSDDVIVWADGVLKAHADRKAILTTHGYLDGSGNRSVHVMGSTQYIWDGLVVPNDNVYFVLCGHVAAEHCRTDVVNGRQVHQLLADYQTRANGGDGWLRLLRFSPSQGAVHVQTYSPWLDQYETDADSDFVLSFPMGGFAVIGTDLAVPSSTNASTAWSGLAENAAYEWYATATDPAGKTAIGPVWSFTTLANDPPVALDDSYYTDEDLALTVPAPGVLANDTDPEDDPLTAELVSDAGNGAVILNPDGSFTYTPAPDFSGTDSFTYAANDGSSDSNDATVMITVRPINDPPVADDQSVTTDEDTPIGITLTASDADGDPLTYSVVAGPSCGTLSGSAPLLTYTPEPDYNGPDSFTFLANDGSADSNLATVAITADPVNDAPVAEDDAAATDEDTPVAIAVLANDGDVDGDPLTVAEATDGANGTVAINPDNTLTYTPAADFYGGDSFAYTLSDGNGGTDVATVAVTVHPINDPPVAVDDAYAVDEDSTLTVPAPGVLGNDSDPEGDPLTAVLVGGVGDGTLSLDPDGSFAYTPAPDFTGTDSFAYVANDGAADSSPATVTITVTPVAETITIADIAAPATVAQYEKAELLVTLDHVAATAFYEPDPAQGGLDLSATFTGPGGAPWAIHGFYDGTEWLIRFAPEEAGSWTYAVSATDPSGTSSTVEGSFECEESAHPGWARIDGHYLRFSEGQAFFGVGHNNGWQLDVEQPTLSAMAARGEDLLSFWLATPWAEPAWGPEWASRAPIENASQGIGDYNQAACAYLDAVVERAEAAGVYLLPTIWPHCQLRDDSHPWGDGKWYNNAYSTICSAGEFFNIADTPQWRYQRNFYRYLLARWGYSRAVVGWVGVCEIDGTTGYYGNPSQAEAWCTAVQAYFQAHDPFRRNAFGEYPIAFTKVDEPSWRSGFDLRATDSYQSQADDTGVAETLASQTRTMWGSGQPCFHAEFGGDTVNGASQPAHLHNGLWAAAAAGAALTPLVWCDGGNFPMLTDAQVGEAMRDQLECVSQFMRAIDYLGEPGLGPATLSFGGKFGQQCRGWGMALGDRGFAWMRKLPRPFDGKQVLTISSLVPGTYTVAWFDTWASGAVPVQTDTASAGPDGALSVKIPRLDRNDVACKFQSTGGNQPPVANDDSATTEPDAPVIIDVLANDSDPEGDPLTITDVTQGSDGSVVDNGDGTVTYTPNAGFTGIDEFTYTISDGNGGMDAATVTVTVGAGPMPSIYGWITDPDQSGLPDITVNLEKLKGKKWGSEGSTTTDAEGYYGFADLKPGTYRVTPVSEAWSFTPSSAEVVVDTPGDHELCDFSADPK